MYISRLRKLTWLPVRLCDALRFVVEYNTYVYLGRCHVTTDSKFNLAPEIYSR